MPDARCLNCDAALSGTPRFCPNCGQRTDTARLAAGDMLRELMHAFVNVERGPLSMLYSLALRPGHMARDYVEGRRRRYYGPFATLATLVGAAALLVSLAGYKMLAQDGFDAGVTDLLQRHFNLLLLLQLPVIGLVCAVVFRSARLNLPEHMVLVAYALGFRTVVLIATVPFMIVVNTTMTPSAAEVTGFWIAWYLYFAWAASQFYAGHRGINAIKGLAAATLAHAVLIGIVRSSVLGYGWASRLWATL